MTLCNLEGVTGVIGQIRNKNEGPLPVRHVCEVAGFDQGMERSYRDVEVTSTTSSSTLPRATDSHLPSSDQAKEKIWLELY